MSKFDWKKNFFSVVEIMSHKQEAILVEYKNSRQNSRHCKTHSDDPVLSLVSHKVTKCYDPENIEAAYHESVFGSFY